MTQVLYATEQVRLLCRSTRINSSRVRATEAPAVVVRDTRKIATVRKGTCLLCLSKRREKESQQTVPVSDSYITISTSAGRGGMKGTPTREVVQCPDMLVNRQISDLGTYVIRERN